MSGDQEVFDITATALPPGDDGDQADDGGQETTGRTGSSSGGASASYTEEELAALFEQRVTPRLAQQMQDQLNRLYQGVQGLTDRQAAAMQKRIDALEGKIAFINQYVEDSWDEERVAEFRRKQRDAELTARERELDARQAAALEAANRAAQQPDADLAQAAVERYFANYVQPELDEYAKEQGVDLLTLADRVPQQLRALANGDPDWRGYTKEVKRLIDAAAAEAERAARVARPRATVDATRPAGGGLSNEAVWKAYGRGELGWNDPRVQAAGRALGAI